MENWNLVSMNKVCIECGSKYVVNKKYCLCQKCNHKRMYGETIEETQLKKFRERQEKKQYNTQERKKTLSYLSKTNKYKKINFKTISRVNIIILIHYSHLSVTDSILIFLFYSVGFHFCGLLIWNTLKFLIQKSIEIIQLTIPVIGYLTNIQYIYLIII